MSPDNINNGRDQNIFNQPQNVNIYSSQQQPRDPVLKTLLGAVQDEVKERLAQSLHRVANANLLNLGKALEPDQVRSPWTMEMSVQARPPKMLPPEMTIAQVFELPDVEHKLLILGEPGSGKTTTLLELTQTLVTQALGDPSAPMPVLVNLSSWRDPQQPIFDWLVNELKVKYGLHPVLGRQFLGQKSLLPFLDGLDEVATSRQEACALGLNAWLTGNIEQQPVGVVICCRRKEYEEIVRKRLFLCNSVELQPLTDEQMEVYLKQFRLGSVWESVQASPQLRDLLRKPLFLAIFGLVSTQFNFFDWQQCKTESEQIEYLFDQYWNWAIGRALLEERSRDQGILSKTYNKKKLPENNTVRRTLIFIARVIQQDFQTEFLIENVQQNCLFNRTQKWQCWIIIACLHILFLAVFSIIFLGINDGVLYGILGGSVHGFFACLNNVRIFEFFKFSISLFLRGFIVIGVFAGVLYGFVAGSIFGLISGLIFGLIGGIVIGIKIDSVNSIKPNQGIKNLLQNMLIITVLSFLLSALLKFLLVYPLAGVFHPTKMLISPEFVFLGLIWFGFHEGGGEALIQHAAIRSILAWNGYAPYRYDKLLDYCTERLLLQRIGGRYRFMHKLLQEHFAKMPLD
jgi:DNA polymerase III delta prime subunit